MVNTTEFVDKTLRLNSNEYSEILRTLLIKIRYQTYPDFLPYANLPYYLMHVSHLLYLRVVPPCANEYKLPTIYLET